MNKTMQYLLLLTALLTAVACGDRDVDSADTQAPVNEPESAVGTETEDLYQQYDPQIPAEDFGGVPFCVIYGDYELEPNLDFCAEEENAEPLNDAIFARNRAMEEKYNIDVTWEHYSSEEARTKLQTAARAGEDVYSLYCNNVAYSFSEAMQGYTQELNDFPYLDFTKPYWNNNMISASSINCKNYFVYSDINIHSLGATPCVLFNKTVATSYDIGDLYAIVENGDWTMETMGEMVKGVTRDLDGDGKIGEDDMHGFIGNDFVVDCLLSGTGYQTITKDENDLPLLNLQTEAYYNIIEAISTLCAEENGSFICDRYKNVDREYAPMNAFDQDRALFWIANLKGVERMRNMESEFGILPIPKLDASQKEYKIHYQANVGGAMSVPITVSNTTLVGKVLEDMSYLSMQSVKPAYIDVLLEGKFLRDEESLVTLEIMFDSYYCDIGFMTGASGITITEDLRDFVANNRRDYVSGIDKKMKSYTKLLTEIIDTYLEDNQ